MAASKDDKASAVSNGGVPVFAIVQADRAPGSGTLTLDLLTYWPVTTGIKYSTFRKDPSDPTKVLAGTQQDWKGVVSGNTITNVTLTSSGADLGNLTNDVAVMMPTAQWGQDFIDAFLAEHSNPNGAHTNIHAISIATSGDASIGGNAAIVGTLTVGGVSITQLISSGIITMTAATSAPLGWLLCDGTAVSRTTYASLFTAIGTAYGVGDGSTTFNVPNFKGKAPFGLDSSQSEFTPIGTAGGQKTVQAHSHGVNDGGHNHRLWSIGQESNVYTLGGTSTRAVLIGGSPNSGNGNTGDSNANISIQSAGSGSNNLNPYLTVNFIIKT